MASGADETTVNESFAVTIPASVRADMDLQPGDRLRWEIDEEGRLVAEVLRERHGLAEELEPVDMGETDAVGITEAYDWS